MGSCPRLRVRFMSFARDNEFLQYLLFKSTAGDGLASAQLWLQIVFLACLFATALLRPEAIRSKPLFRGACILFVLSLLVSPTVNFLLGYFLSHGSGGSSPYPTRGLDEDVLLAASVPSMLGSVLFGLSIICSFFSLELSSLRRTHGAIAPQTVSGWGSTGEPSQPATPETTETAEGDTEKKQVLKKYHPLDEPD
jgi:hypothetical protein